MTWASASIEHSTGRFGLAGDLVSREDVPYVETAVFAYFGDAQHVSYLRLQGVQPGGFPG